MYRFFVLVLLCVVLCGCSGGGGEPKTPLPTRSAVLDQGFTLRVGQDARFEGEGLTVTLRGVPDDSRCPEDAQCVWEGSVRVQVELKTASDPGTIVELNTISRVGSPEETYQSYTVQLVSIAPNKGLSRAIKPDEYIVGLIVKRR